MSKQNKLHWKKFLAFFFIASVAIVSRAVNWLDVNWFGAILTVITVTFIISECFDNYTDVKIRAGLSGVDVEAVGAEIPHDADAECDKNEGDDVPKKNIPEVGFKK